MYAKPNTVPDLREMITNGDFDTDSGWEKQTGWTIEDGVAKCDGSQIEQTFLRQQANLITNKRYIVEFTISNYVAGTIKTGLGGYVAGTTFSANGRCIEIYAASNPLQSGIFFFYADLNFIGHIDDVTVKQVRQKMQ